MMDENKKSRKDQAEETKRHIFYTALKLLDEKGFDKITIRDIVREADVSVGTFYYYYASKMDVYYETYCLADEYFEKTVLPHLTQRTASKQILCFFDYYARYCSEFTSLALTSILFNSNNECFDRDSEIGILRILPQLMANGLGTGELHADESPQSMARFFMISVRGLVYDWCIHHGSYQLSEALRQHVEKLLRIYRTQPMLSTVHFHFKGGPKHNVNVLLHGIQLFLSRDPEKRTELNFSFQRFQ